MRRFSSRLTSGRSRTPRTRLKMAALAPMPSASVATTVMVSPFVRANERAANFTSFRKVMQSLLFVPPPYETTHLGVDSLILQRIRHEDPLRPLFVPVD